LHFPSLSLLWLNYVARRGDYAGHFIINFCGDCPNVGTSHDKTFKTQTNKKAKKFDNGQNSKMAFIPPNLLGELGKLADKEKSAVSKEPSARRVSTRIKGFSSGKADDQVPVFSSQELVNTTANGTPNRPKPVQQISNGGATIAHGKSVHRTSVAKENAYVHLGTAKRVSHLTQKENAVNDPLLFIYDALDKANSGTPKKNDTPVTLDTGQPQTHSLPPQPQAQYQHQHQTQHSKTVTIVDDLKEAIKPVSEKDSIYPEELAMVAPTTKVSAFT
jgi:ribosome-binding protein aMBF1 (putative translation factor)